MQHCENCKYMRTDGYEYPESYCWLGIGEENPKFDEDEIGCGCRYNFRTLRKMEQRCKDDKAKVATFNNDECAEDFMDYLERLKHEDEVTK